MSKFSLVWSCFVFVDVSLWGFSFFVIYRSFTFSVLSVKRFLTLFLRKTLFQNKNKLNANFPLFCFVIFAREILCLLGMDGSDL